MHSCPVKHGPYRRSTRRPFAANREQVTQSRLTDDPFEGTNRRARSVMPDPWLWVYNAMHTPVSTEANSTPTTANPARTEDIPLGGYPKCVRQSPHRGGSEGSTEPCSRPKVRASSRGSCFALTVDTALAALIDITDIKALNVLLLTVDRTHFACIPVPRGSDYAILWQTLGLLASRPVAGGEKMVGLLRLRLAAGVCVLAAGLLMGAGGAVAFADPGSSGSAANSTDNKDQKKDGTDASGQPSTARIARVTSLAAPTLQASLPPARIARVTSLAAPTLQASLPPARIARVTSLAAPTLQASLPPPARIARVTSLAAPTLQASLPPARIARVTSPAAPTLQASLPPA